MSLHLCSFHYLNLYLRAIMQRFSKLLQCLVGRGGEWGVEEIDFTYHWRGRKRKGVLPALPLHTCAAAVPAVAAAAAAAASVATWAWNSVHSHHQAKNKLLSVGNVAQPPVTLLPEWLDLHALQFYLWMQCKCTLRVEKFKEQLKHCLPPDSCPHMLHATLSMCFNWDRNKHYCAKR